MITKTFKYRNGDDYFQQYPMNFFDLDQQQILPYWCHYYRQLGRDIPQGISGSYPQQLLRQKQLFASMTIIRYETN